MAEKYVAIPGTSEHQLGLSVDINANQTKCSSEKVYSWLDNNAYKYGFIKRYPSNKSYITRIHNEPWHYRYVGKEAAATMKNQNLCLEEYLKKYKFFLPVEISLLPVFMQLASKFRVFPLALKFRDSFASVYCCSNLYNLRSFFREYLYR